MLPGWDKAAKPLVESDKLVMLGVIQEQHAERCRLYAQWKQFKFPIVQDAMTQLDMAVVPVPVFIDENGITRATRIRPNQLAGLVETKYEDATVVPRIDPEHVQPEFLAKRVKESPDAANFVALGDAHLNWGGPSGASPAIEAYQQAEKLEPKNAKISFRLGVAYRKRFDSDQAQSDDFNQAVRHWTTAVNRNRNQYIWGRRIQQYGPRQIKPYPFYDWVATAQREITARGEKPIQLNVALSGAEIAQPQRTFAAAKESNENPDSDNQINRDTEGLIQFHTTVVPAKIKRGQSARIHIRMSPSIGKWNNEAEPVVVWIESSDQYQCSEQLIRLQNPAAPESKETRRIEFEVKTNKASDSCAVKGYALYYACHNENGQCVFVRQDFEIPVDMTP